MHAMDHKTTILEAARINAVNVGDRRASAPEDNLKNGLDLVDKNPSPKKTSSRATVKSERVQTLLSRAPERQKRFPAIVEKPLVILRTSAPTFDRFTFSPLSPKAFPRFNPTDLDALPERSSLLERYLETQEGHSPVHRQSSDPIVAIHRPASDQRIARTPAHTGLDGSTFTAPLPQREFESSINQAFLRLEERSKRQTSASASHAHPATSTSGNHDSFQAKTFHSNTNGSRSGRSPTSSRSSHQRKDKRRSSSQSAIASSRSRSRRHSNENPKGPHRTVSSLKVDAPTVILPFDQILLSPSLAKECGLPSPPPAPTSAVFGNNVPALTVGTGSSPFDPPPAPVRDSFPLMFPASPSFCGPAPIDTSLEVEEFPILLGERFRAIEGGRFQTVDTPINPPPAPMRDRFPLEFAPSPKRAGPCPIDTSAVYVSGPLSTWNDVSPSDSITPTQTPPVHIGELIPAPLLVAGKTTRFADLSLSTESRTSDGQSPPVFSPITPVAMSHAFPFIISASPPMQIEEVPQQDFQTLHTGEKHGSVPDKDPNVEQSIHFQRG